MNSERKTPFNTRISSQKQKPPELMWNCKVQCSNNYEKENEMNGIKKH